MHSLPRTPAAVQCPLCADLVDLTPQLRDAVADKAPVSLDLCLTRPAGANAAFEALKVAPLPGEPRQQVLRLREFNLQARLPRLGAAGEDVDDQGRPVEDFDLQCILEVALLRWRQLIVEDDQRVVALVALGDYLLELAFANVGSGMWRIEPLDGAPGNLSPCRVSQQRQLIERGLGIEAVMLAPRFDGDEEGALRRRCGGVSDGLLRSLLQ